MIVEAEKRGEIRPGDTLIEATSGNTGIALAMVAAMKGYRMVLVMPENQSLERRQTMRAYGAELVLTPEGGRHGGARATLAERDARARDAASSSTSSPIRTIRWRTTAAPAPRSGATPTAAITHFVSAMGTTGTIMGVSRFLKERNPAIAIIGAQPAEGAQIPGIRKWPEAYLPRIYDALARRSRRDRDAGRGRGHHAPPRGRGGHLLRHLRRRRLRGRAADRPRGRERGRSSSSSATAATATCPPASSPAEAHGRPRRHDPDPRLRHRDRAGRRRPAARPRPCARPRRRRRARLGGPAAARSRPAAISCSCTSSRVVAIGCALRDGDGFKIASVGERGRCASPSSSGASSTCIDKHTPQLVSWNGGGFDLPVLQPPRADPRRRPRRSSGTGATTTATSSTTATSAATTRATST